jgi:hypothetical protein
MTTIDRAPAPRLQAAGYGPPGGYGGGPPGGYGGPPPGAGGPPPGGGYGGPPPGGYGGPPPGGGYGPPPGAGFGPPGQIGGGRGPRVHPLAYVSLAAGILSLPACCCWFFGFPMTLCAIVCGVLALGKIKQSPQLYSGTLFCWIGIGCGGFGLVLSTGFHLTSYGELLRHRYGRRF